MKKASKKKITNTNPLQGDKMAKLTINSETNEVNDINQEIMVTALKVLALYDNNEKVCYFSKWKPFFNNLFPTEKMKTKNGYWIMALSAPTSYALDQDGNQYIKNEGALAFLVRQGFIEEHEKAFKSGFTGKLYNIKAGKRDKVDEILNNFVRDFDAQLFEEIQAEYDKMENSQDTNNFKSSTASFASMGFTS